MHMPGTAASHSTVLTYCQSTFGDGVQVSTAQASHTRHLSEAAQLRQELRQLSGRLELAESDQQHLEATCKQTTATAEAEWAVKVRTPVCVIIMLS